MQSKVNSNCTIYVDIYIYFIFSIRADLPACDQGCGPKLHEEIHTL